MPNPKGRRPSLPSPWYQKVIEQLSRHAVDKTKSNMLVVLEKKRIVSSFNHMHKILGGKRNRALLAWQELRQSGEVVECKLGWCKPGMAKYVNDRAADGYLDAKLKKDGWGEHFRNKWLEEQNPQLKAAREAMEAAKRKNAPMDAVVAEARRVLDAVREANGLPTAEPNERKKDGESP
jgi:hypothetical protein